VSAYLQNLTIRLATGVGQLPESVRQKHTDYFLAAQQDDGGFGGREGESDLYYTTFAMRGLSILGELYGEVADRIESFLKPKLTSHQTIVDFFSLFYAANLLKVSAGNDIFVDSDPNWPDQVASFLETLRREDGGYAKAQEGHAGSTYHTFLVILVLELIERPIPHPEKIISFLDSQREAEGGWREIRASKRAGTNPTAAAVASLSILNAINEAEDPELVATTLDFLVEMQTEEGGLRANTRIPIADLLSSFTGGLTLMDLDAFNEIDIPAYRKFVDAMQREQGGFQAAAWDNAHDVEYSFYGLGCLALLANHEAS
jgi:geranylgeranyl transferase type-2 subunit beta